MAMSLRTGGLFSGRPRAILGRVYEEFKPMSEWKKDDESHILRVHLPGFEKEYIKVTTEDRNILRVRGERMMALSKWSRFREDFQVPEDCDMRGIRAMFAGGVLTVIMPPKVPIAPVESKGASKPTAQENLKEPTPPQAPTRDGTTENSQEHASSGKGDGKKSAEEPSPTNPSAKMETSPEPMPLKYTGKQRDGGVYPGIVKKEEKEAKEKPFDPGMPRQASDEKIANRERETTNAGKVNFKKRDSERDPRVSFGGHGLGLEDYKKAAKGLFAKGKSDERDLLVNVGVAILVIAALGAQIFYGYESNMNAKN